MTVSPSARDEAAAEARDAFAENLAETTTSMMEMATVYIGHHLGYYQTLADHVALNAQQLADLTDTNQRYAREWLEQQSVAGILTADDPAAAPEERRFGLPPGYAEVLLDRDSLVYMSGRVRMAMAVVNQAPAVLEAFRTGGGVPYDLYNPDASEGMDEGNRPSQLHLFAKEWVPQIADLHLRLQADPPARVADLGSGSGWVSIGLARQYPNITVDGFDYDAPSVELATRNAEEFGVADRVRFHTQDVTHLDIEGEYDVALCFLILHDLPQPVSMLRAMRSMVNEDGTVLVFEPVISSFPVGTGTQNQRFFYSASVLHCIPVAMVDQPSAAVGATMPLQKLRQFVVEAGFSQMEMIPVWDENFVPQLFRLYL